MRRARWACRTRTARIAVGMPANFVLWNVREAAELAYWFGQRPDAHDRAARPDRVRVATLSRTCQRLLFRGRRAAARRLGAQRPARMERRRPATQVTPDAHRDADTPARAGPVIPGMPNLHSHAFQRAFGGLTEFRGAAQDSFWSWRTLMYRFAAQISPAAGRSDRDLALHRDARSRLHVGLRVPLPAPRRRRPALRRRCHPGPRAAARGAARRHRPHAAAGALPDQRLRRPAAGRRPAPLHPLDRIDAAPARSACSPLCEAQGARLGLAPHSLRAVPPEALARGARGAGCHRRAPRPSTSTSPSRPREVDACLAWSGQRPVAWLLDHAAVDARWCLVHATHMDADEYRRAAASGAVAGLCPTTEANLGDGIFDFSAWRAAGGRWGIGSDSHACVNAAEELLMLEYSQRLATRQRNVGADARAPRGRDRDDARGRAGRRAGRGPRDRRPAPRASRPTSSCSMPRMSRWPGLPRRHAFVARVREPSHQRHRCGVGRGPASASQPAAMLLHDESRGRLRGRAQPTSQGLSP